MKVITQFVNPPVASRAYDWQANFKGAEEPGDRVGHGATEGEAIANLYEQLNEDALDIVEKLGKLADGLDNGNSSAEYKVAELANRAKRLQGSEPGRAQYLGEVIAKATQPAAQPAAPEDWRDLVLMALPNYVPQEDWLLSPCAPLMSEDSHEMMHWDTIEKIVKAVAAPPVAQRQPLTDEQIEKMMDEHSAIGWTYWQGVRDAEAAHGITGEKT